MDSCESFYADSDAYKKDFVLSCLYRNGFRQYTMSMGLRLSTDLCNCYIKLSSLTPVSDSNILSNTGTSALRTIDMIIVVITTIDYKMHISSFWNCPEEDGEIRLR